MKKKIVLLVLAFAISFFIVAQNGLKADQKTIAKDCRSAFQLSISTSFIYESIEAPHGFGELQDISSANAKLIEREHNSAWYLLSIEKTGELTFLIHPHDSINDYDFLLYRYTDADFCTDLSQNRLLPVRSNLSNTKKSQKGLTGLSAISRENFIKKGIGDPFSKSLYVKKGEKYMLLLDNVSEARKGFKLIFNFIKEIEIKGKVLDSSNAPIKSDISLSDSQGNIVFKTNSDVNGKYRFKAKIEEGKNYVLTFVPDSNFIGAKTVNTLDSFSYTDIRVVLPRLKKGGKYKFEGINFYPNSVNVLRKHIPRLMHCII